MSVRANQLDAAAAALDRQLAFRLGAIYWHRIDGSRSPAEVARGARKALDCAAAAPG